MKSQPRAGIEPLSYLLQIHSLTTAPLFLNTWIMQGPIYQNFHRLHPVIVCTNCLDGFQTILFYPIQSLRTYADKMHQIPPHWDLPTFVLSVGFIFVHHGKDSMYTSAVCPHFGAVRSEINIFLTSHILKSENQHKLYIIFYSESPNNTPPPPGAIGGCVMLVSIVTERYC